MNSVSRCCVAACIWMVCAVLHAASYDVIIRGGTVYDGTGFPGIVTDVAVSDDRIAAIGDLGDAEAVLVVDASGLAIAPGFINMLSWAVGSLIQDGRGLSDIKQGVTLEVFGEGWSMGPLPEGDQGKALLQDAMGEDAPPVEWQTLGEYLEYLEQKGVSPNVASFVGATTLRIHEIGFDDRPPSAEELERMKALTRQAMEEGAMGLGSSLIYPPAFFASTEELIELASVVGEYGGRYISHMRSEGNRIEDSVAELIRIAREGGVGAEIYHLKMAGQQNWGKLPAITRMIEDARAEGLDITTDMYTYVAGGTSLTACFPPWASEGGAEELLKRLRQPDSRARIVAAMGENADDWENLYYGAGPGGVLLSSVANDDLRDLMGRTIADVASERGTDPAQTVVDLVLEAEGEIGAIYFLMSEDNVKRQIRLPWMSFGSDAAAMAPEGRFLERGTHPRAYGNFARLLGKYVREEKVISLQEAVHRLTLLPATNLKIPDRGRLAPGFYADIAIFDPAVVRDRATFKQPHQLAEGMVHVFVNGQQVLRDGEHTGALPGRVVRGPGYRP
ncbi:MAG: D-aminoacylase [Xanthomonadales bacterium]|nr:D-aminoacylase [Xanthomonadales bacterium]